MVVDRLKRKLAHALSGAAHVKAVIRHMVINGRFVPQSGYSKPTQRMAALSRFTGLNPTASPAIPALTPCQSHCGAARR